MLRTALDYAGRGWAVFPVRGKIPAIPKDKGGNGVHDATMDEAQIRRWWEAPYRNCNIGVATGEPSGFWVLDLDGAEAEIELSELERQHGQLPSTLQQVTGGGGRHFLFEYHGEPIRNRAKDIAPGLDTRATGGFIVVAPSVHPETGAEYAWRNDPQQTPIMVAPDWLMHLACTSRREREHRDEPRPTPVARLSDYRQDFGAPSAYALAALKGEVEAITSAGYGRQEFTLNAASVKIGGLVGAGALKLEHAQQALIEAGMQMGSQPGREPWIYRDVAAKVERGLRDGIARPRDVPPPRQLIERNWRDDRGKRAFGTAPSNGRSGGGGTPPSGGPEDPPEQRPQIQANDGDLARMTERAWAALKDSNDPPYLFRYGSIPSRVETDDQNLPIPMVITEERLRHELARMIDWYKRGEKGDESPAHPPMAVVRDMLATPDIDLPILAGIVTAPVFGPRGTLHTQPGYHAHSQLLYSPEPGFKVPTVPAEPESADVDFAKHLIIEELLHDFPFTGEAEIAHAVALFLLPFVRPMIKGATPLHLIEKPSPGTGATLMIDAIATVATGAGASVMTEGRDEDEWRKRLTAKLRTSPGMILIDNLKRTLDSAALAAVITAPVWEDRILGGSTMVRLPVRNAWVATGNNPKVSNEIARRTVRIRLDAKRDRPWQRTEFKHKDILAWIRENRGQLVWAALVLAQSWIAAGRPAPGHNRALGMFESWAEVIGGILENAQIAGFLGNLDEFYEASDAEGQIWRSFIATWWEKYTTQAVGTSDLYDIAKDVEPPMRLGDGAERSQKIRLGLEIGKARDRQFSVSFNGETEHQFRLLSAGAKQRAQHWKLQHLCCETDRGSKSECRSEGSSQHSPLNRTVF